MKRRLAQFLYALLGGAAIALGGTIFLRVRDAIPGGLIVGAVLFTIGLFTICTRGYLLYTGKGCYLFDNRPDYVLDLFVIWLGNFAGTVLLAGLERMTLLCAGSSGISATARGIVEAKMTSGYGNLFLLGILCNIFIFLAVNGFAKNPHELGKYLALFLGVCGFILAGTEHCVADMYYWAVSGVLFEQPLDSLGRIAVISLGNLAGGVAFPLAERLKAWLERDAADPKA